MHSKWKKTVDADQLDGVYSAALDNDIRTLSRRVNRKKPRYDSLHDWLDRTGTQQRILAKLARMSPGHLSMILRGSRRCSLQRALLLSTITGVPIERIAEWPRDRVA